jgi:hypothetical protein
LTGKIVGHDFFFVQFVMMSLTVKQQRRGVHLVLLAVCCSTFLILHCVSASPSSNTAPQGGVSLWNIARSIYSHASDMPSEGHVSPVSALVGVVRRAIDSVMDLASLTRAIDPQHDVAKQLDIMTSKRSKATGRKRESRYVTLSRQHFIERASDRNIELESLPGPHWQKHVKSFRSQQHIVPNHGYGSIAHARAVWAANSNMADNSQVDRDDVELSSRHHTTSMLNAERIDPTHFPPIGHTFVRPKQFSTNVKDGSARVQAIVGEELWNTASTDMENVVQVIELSSGGAGGQLRFVKPVFNFSKEYLEWQFEIGVECFNCTGSVSVFVQSISATAIAGQDYKGVNTQVTWNDASVDSIKHVPVTRIMRPDMNKIIEFAVVFSQLSGSNNVQALTSQQNATVVFGPAKYCGYGVPRAAYRPYHMCSQKNGNSTRGRVEDLVYSVETAALSELSARGLSCSADVSQYFGISPSFSDANDTAAVQQLCSNATALALSIDPNSTVTQRNLTEWCAFWNGCWYRSNCESYNDTRDVCHCPLDFRGETCTTATANQCELRMPASCDANSQEKALPGYGYNWKLDGIPPCMYTEDNLKVNFSVDCFFTETVVREGAWADKPGDLAGFSWNPHTFDYLVRTANDRFALLSAPGGYKMQLKFYNFNVLSMMYSLQTPISASALAGNDTTTVIVPFQDLTDTYAAGGRLYSEFGFAAAYGYRLPVDWRTDRAVFEVPGYTEPPYTSSDGLSTFWLIFIVTLVCVIVCFGGFWYRRRRELKQTEAHIEMVEQNHVQASPNQQ